MIRLSAFILIGFSVLLSGCSQWSFNKGTKLINDGRMNEGFVEIEKAIAMAPDNQEFRMYYLRQRELAVKRILTQGDIAKRQGQDAAAEAAYLSAIELDSSNPLPKIALESLYNEQRQNEILNNAESSYKAGNLAEAQFLAQQLLLENPQNRTAQNVLRKIEEARFGIKNEPQLNEKLQNPITVEFRDTDLKSIFELLSRNTGINFFFDKDVRPDLRTTVFVRDTSMDEVIRFVLKTNQLTHKVLNENTILIYPDTAAKVSEYQDLVTKSFYLSHADVKQTANMIKTLVKTKDLFVDEKLRLLIMRDKPAAIRMAEKLVAVQDIAESEVMLEVEVLEIASGLLTNLGIRYPTSITGSVTGSGGTPGTMTLPEWQNLNSGLFSFSIGDPAMVLNLRDQKTGSNTLANPRIRVKNNEKASIHIGDKVPVITTTVNSTNFASESVSYLDVGLKLEVQPTISLSSEVEIKVNLEVSNIISQVTTNSGSIAYRMGNRNANTVLHLNDGETQVLAGLINQEDQSTADRIPVLGQIPVLGRLFSNHSDTKSKTEIVLLITPRIIRTVSPPSVRITEFLSGTENVVGAPPLLLRNLSPAQRVTETPATAGNIQPVSPAAQPVVNGAPTLQENNFRNHEGRLTIQAPQQITIGEEFTMIVSLSTDVPLQSGTISLAYDPNRFKVKTIEPAELLTNSNQKPSMQQNIQEIAGRLSISYASEIEIKGQGALARIIFQAAGPPGTSIIRMETPTSHDAGGNEIMLSTSTPLSLSLSR